VKPESASNPPPLEIALEIKGLTKVFGDHAALDGVDLIVPAGSVFGFLGPNGAGMTTTLRILTGLAHPSAGRAAIFGRDIREDTDGLRSLIGFLPDVPGFYSWMTAKEFLQLTGRIFGLDRRALHVRVSALLDMVGLEEVKTRIGGYSRGMKQRLGIAQALVHAPRLLMLDEPTSALDPIGRKEVLETIQSLAGRTTVFFSSHILSDVERVCDTVAILDRGRILTQAPVKELKAREGPRRIFLEVVTDTDTLESTLEDADWVRHIERAGEGILLTVSDLARAQHRIPAVVASAGLALQRMETMEATLEEVFMDMVEQGKP